MKAKDVKNVEDYRNFWGEQADKMSDQDITNLLYDTLKNDGIDLDYYEYSNSLNKNSPFQDRENFINTYKKELPDLHKLDDLSIADIAHGKLIKRGTKIKFRDFLNQFTQKKTVKGVYDSEKKEFIGFEEIEEPFTTAEIAEKFDIAEPGYMSFLYEKFGQDLALSEEQGLGFIKRSLSEKFGQDVEIRRGAKTDEIEFYNPKTKKYTLLNKPGLDPTDLATVADDAFVIGTDLIGSVYAFGKTLKKTGNPKAAIGAASVTSGFAVPFSNYLSDILGAYITNENITLSQAAEMSAKKNPENFSLVSAGFTAAGFTAPAFIKFLDNKLKGKNKSVSGNDLKLLYGDNKEKIDEAAEILQGIRNRETELHLKSKANFSLAEASEDIDALTMFVAYSKNPKYRSMFDDFDKTRQEAFKNFYFSSKKGFTSEAVRGNNVNAVNELDDLIQKILANRQNAKIQEASAIQQQSKTSLDNVSVQLSDGSFKDAGKQITSSVESIYNGINKDFTKKYDNLFNLKVGGKTASDRTVDADLIQNVYKDFKAAAEKSQIPAEDISKFFKNPNKQKVDGKIVDRTTYTLEELKSTMTDLLTKSRDQFGGANFPKGYPEKFINSIEETFKRDLGVDDPWLSQYVKLSDDYRLFKGEFDNIANRLIKVKDGRLKIENEDVFNAYFKVGKGQEARVEQIVNILSKDKDKLKIFRDSTESFYKKYITDLKTGQFDLNKHKKFMDEYGDSLKVIFPDAKKFNNMGDAIQAFNKAENVYQETLKKLSNSTEGKLLSKNPGDIFNTVYKTGNVSELQKVFNIIKTDSATTKALQTRVTDDLYNMSVKKGTINEFDAIKFLDNYRNQLPKLKVLFKDNQKYLKDLELFAKSQQIMLRTNQASGGVGNVVNETLIGVLRTNVAPPLSKRGRALTAAVRFLNTRYNNRMAKILTDPDLLDSYNKFMRLNKSAQKNKSITKTEFYNKLYNKVFGFGAGVVLKNEFYQYPDTPQDVLPDEKIKEINRENRSQNLSQVPVNVAQMDMPQSQSNIVAGAPVTNVNNQQGIAALSPGQGSGTNAQTIDRMAQVGLPLFNRG